MARLPALLRRGSDLLGFGFDLGLKLGLGLGLALCASVPALAQAPAAAPAAAPAGTVLVTLGTQGGPVPTPARSQPANALIVNGQPYLIDAGNGVARQLALANIRYTAIRQIFITHHHDDHNADLGTLMGMVWSIGVPAPITAYGPNGTGEFLEGFKRSFVINQKIRESDFPELYKITPDAFFLSRDIGEAKQARTIFEDKNVKVDAIQNCHYHFAPGAPAGAAASYAFRFKTADKTIVISGDTGPCPQLVDFARGADILVHEVISLDSVGAALRGQNIPDARIAVMMRHMEEDHSTPEVVGKLAAQAGVGMVVLTHVIPGSDDVPDSAYTEGVAREFKGKVVVAKDLMRF